MTSVVSGIDGINIPALQSTYNSLLTENVTLTRKTTTTDGTGMITDGASVSVPITCRIMPLSDKTRHLEEYGQAISGESIGYFRPSYTYLSVTYVVAEGDLITSSANTYRVEKVVHSQHIGTDQIYIKTLLKLI